MPIGDFLGITPFISYVTIAVLESFFAIDSFDESFKLYCQNSHRNFLCREQREAIGHIMSDRLAGDSMSADSCPVIFFGRFKNLLHEIEVLGIDMSHGLISYKVKSS